MNTKITDDLTTPKANGSTAAAWALVMDNYDEITRYATQMAAKAPSIDADELLNAGIVTCIEHFPWFDPALGDGAKFAYWQVRRACTQMLRQAGAGRALLCSMNPGEPDVLHFEINEGEGHARQMEARTEVNALLAVMTPEEQAAVYSKAAGLTGPEIEQTLGLSMPGRNQRIYRLRRRLDAGLETT